VPLALGGVPLRLTDTAGLRETEDQVEAIGVERAASLVEAADVLLWLGEPADAPEHPRLIRLHAKSDVRDGAPAASLPVSSITGEGIGALLERVEALSRSLLPAEDVIALNRRQAGLVVQAQAAVREAASKPVIVLLAEQLRSARGAFDRLTGRAGVEDVLEALFGRFCLGK
jgi:tRNA modification GTPase